MDPAIKKELAALREEIDSLRAEKRGERPEAPPSGAEGAADDRAKGPAGVRDDGPEAWADQLKEMIAAIQGALESAESGVVVHPIAGVAAAFAAGLLIGRLTKSR
jgi:ElaB/YqjD/DUF883 family membrane-anchored ribosome-binding protein